MKGPEEFNFDASEEKAPEEGVSTLSNPEYSGFTPVEGEKRMKLREELEEQGFPLNEKD